MNDISTGSVVDIKEKFVTSVAWQAIGKLASLGIQFIVTILIARVLTPADYGVIGLLTVFIALGDVFVDSGFSQALIQKREATDVDFSSVFYVNLLLGIVIYLFLYIFSRQIAEFYSIPDLVKYSRILFLIIPITSVGIIQGVIIQKRLEFRKIAQANIFAALLSGGIGIYAAYSGYGIMALVFQQMSMYMARTICLIYLQRWMPKYRFSLQAIKEMFPFSCSLLFSSTITVIFANIYTIIIGRFFASEDVGYYNQAQRFVGVTAAVITDIVLQVSFPLFVNYRGDTGLMKKIYIKVMSITVYGVCPLMCLLICISENLFHLILTEKWLPAVPYFNLLCMFGILLPLYRINTNIFKIFKCGRQIVYIEIVRRLILVGAICLTLDSGIYYMLVGQVVSMLLIVIINMYYSGKLINYKFLEQVKDVMPSYLISIVTALFVIYTLPLVPSLCLSIFLKTILYIGIYLALSCMFNAKNFHEVNGFVKGYILSRFYKIIK